MTDPLSEDDVFSVQINVIDSVTRAPNPKYDPVQTIFMNSKIERVPLIQIFGKTKNKKNEVVLIHTKMQFLILLKNFLAAIFMI